MADSTADTLEHIEHVDRLLSRFASELLRRGVIHDASKLESPEKEGYDQIGVKLAGVTYGSPEYRTTLKALKPTIQHHYQHNSHHPEHYKDGIAGMDLLDLVEMFCDWKAASLRHADGNFRASLDINKDRFDISDQLYLIFQNSVGLVE